MECYYNASTLTLTPYVNIGPCLHSIENGRVLIA